MNDDIICGLNQILGNLIQNHKDDGNKEINNLNKLDNVWVVIYYDGDHRCVDVISHEYPIQHEIIEFVCDELKDVNSPTGVYKLSGNIKSTHYEHTGEFGCDLIVDEFVDIFNSDSVDVDCDYGEYKIVFFVKDGVYYILKANDRFNDMLDQSRDNIMKVIHEFSGGNVDDGVYCMNIKPSGYMRDMVWFSTILKVNDIP